MVFLFIGFVNFLFIVYENYMNFVEEMVGKMKEFEIWLEIEIFDLFYFYGVRWLVDWGFLDE